MIWDLDGARYKKTQAILEYLLLSEPKLAPHYLQLLLVLAKAYLPPITEAEATILVKAFNGVVLPPPEIFGNTHLPRHIADTIRGGFVEEPEAEPIRREVDEGFIDDGWKQGYEGLPEVKFSRRIEKYSAFEALLLLVMVDCFWTSRGNFSSEDPCFTEFFNIAPANTP